MDSEEKQRIWHLFQTDPLGYDPSLFYGWVDHPDLGVLRLTSWRVQIDTTPGETIIWEAE